MLLKRTFRTLPVLLLALGVSAFQFGDEYNLNGMRFADVRSLVSHLGKARAIARKGNIDFFVAQPVQGREVTMHGEITGYLSKRLHVYDHAFCAKACVAGGSPIVFIADSGKVYLVLNSQVGMPLPDKVLNQLGVPGIRIKAQSVGSHDIEALAISSLE